MDGHEHHILLLRDLERRVTTVSLPTQVSVAGGAMGVIPRWKPCSGNKGTGCGMRKKRAR